MALLHPGDPSGIIPQDQALYKLQQVLDGVNVRVGKPMVRLWAWVGAELFRVNHWGLLPHVRG